MLLDYDLFIDKASAFIRSKVEEAKASGVVVGVSGGVDSAVVANLCVLALGKEKVFGVLMPCGGPKQDLTDGLLLVEHLDIGFKVVELEESFKALVAETELDSSDRSAFPLAYGNIKPRLRMTSLYFLGALKNYVVAGTGNKSELMTGYFTKYGDGGVDFEVIGDLFKDEVLELAKYLKLPAVFYNKAPIAGLIGERTDEEEMGITYKALDRFLRTGKGSEKDKERAELLFKNSAHKRLMPPILKIDRN